MRDVGSSYAIPLVKASSSNCGNWTRAVQDPLTSRVIHGIVVARHEVTLWKVNCGKIR